MSDQKMTPEYARLSLEFGLVCANVDSFLKRGPYFCTLARLLCWKLTPELLTEMKTAAINMGVPPEEIELTAEQQNFINDPVTIRSAMSMQAESDARYAQQKKTAGWN